MFDLFDRFQLLNFSLSSLLFFVIIEKLLKKFIFTKAKYEALNVWRVNKVFIEIAEFLRD